MVRWGGKPWLADLSSMCQKCDVSDEWQVVTLGLRGWGVMEGAVVVVVVILGVREVVMEA